MARSCGQTIALEEIENGAIRRFMRVLKVQPVTSTWNDEDIKWASIGEEHGTGSWNRRKVGVTCCETVSTAVWSVVLCFDQYLRDHRRLL